MSATKEVLFYDPNELSELQKEIGVPKMAGPDGEFDSAISVFFMEFRKVIWYTIGLVEMNKSGGGDECTYKVDKKYHYLTRSYFTIELPLLRLSKEARQKYKIRWCMNVGHRIINEDSFIEDETTWQTVNSYWLDTYIQWFERPGHGFRDKRQRDIGN